MIKTFALASIAAAAAATHTSMRLEQLLAQLRLETESKNHTCLTTAIRNKAPLPNFWKLVKGE